ncbi:MAG: DEAD/DEAH box helicase [Bacteroidetes bacterium]|nr:DEAD/DEAH box helicase [Bacteroidota bacterium]MBS1628871.1 DEAD/DEAH box helicase [Bacteroidota bacterium]
MTSFSDFALREEIGRALSEMGYETPTPIQAKTLPLLLSEPTDIIGLAQTGTGKTAAFGLPLLNQIDTDNHDVQALVLSPTRELCMQIEAELNKYGQFLKGFRAAAVYGGVPIGGQIRELKRHPQVIVATPGRLIDLLERGAIHLEEAHTIVLDEADEMLNMGFREDIDFVLNHTPSRELTWLFSATMSQDVRGIAKRFMKSWKEISVAAPNTTNENIDHQYYVTHRHTRFEALQRLLDFTPGIYGIIFTRTKQDAQDVAEKLMRQGYHVSPLHGDMDQKMRSKVMERFKSRTIQVIVATDVAARGIDVSDISHVINFELPDDPEVYTHRSGRTARAGKSGICMSIVTPKEISAIRNIERLVKQKFHRSDIPDGAEVIRKRLFHQLDAIAEAKPSSDFARNYQKEIRERFEGIEAEELIRRMMWLNLRDAIASYEEAEDLNAGFPQEKTHAGAPAGKSTRLFINLGTKDGMTTGGLVRFLAESTDMDEQLISRVTVRELASFFNVPPSAAGFIQQVLPQKKFKGRKVRVDEAEASGGRGFQSDRRHDSRGPGQGKPHAYAPKKGPKFS